MLKSLPYFGVKLPVMRAGSVPSEPSSAMLAPRGRLDDEDLSFDFHERLDLEVHARLHGGLVPIDLDLPLFDGPPKCASDREAVPVARAALVYDTDLLVDGCGDLE